MVEYGCHDSVTYYVDSNAWSRGAEYGLMLSAIFSVAPIVVTTLLYDTIAHWFLMSRAREDTRRNCTVLAIHPRVVRRPLTRPISPREGLGTAALSS